MKDRSIPRVVSAFTARAQFGRIMRQAKERKERFLVSKRGEPQVVIMGIRDFIETIAPEPEVLRLIGKQAKRQGKNKLSMNEIDAEIAAYRRERRAKNSTSTRRLI